MKTKRQYRVILSRQYKKGVRRLEKSGFDLSPLENVVEALSNNESLSPMHHDHPLKGKFQGLRTCHIGPDWLLMYEKNNNQLYLLLVRTGTHRDVLGIE
ncbi:MAG: RelE/StbE family addiction module toxin [Candidatus Peregrinibacteria bacterium Greene0416_19]|nr:MAG: RelE/StbE family addiction module toxin [Candidatus Peregrinibacteria bacterium Greene0416_19]